MQLTDFTPYGAVKASPKGKQVVTHPIQKVLRKYGILTSAKRVKPDYYIVGSKRGGTTSLSKWLVSHPQVASMFPIAEKRKGTYWVCH